MRRGRGIDVRAVFASILGHASSFAGGAGLAKLGASVSHGHRYRSNP